MVIEEKYPEVEPLEQLLPLSFQILRFKMLGRHRKVARRGEQRQEDIHEVQIADPAPNPERIAEIQESRERFRQALLKLGERCRELFRLKLEGRTFPEIREILGASSLNTIYTWDFRCRKDLLRLMGGQWEAR